MYVGQQTRKHFGFCYRTLIGNDQDSNDHGYKIHIVYDCLASPSEKQYSTVNDSPEAITFSWEVTTNPVTINDSLKPAACITVDSTKTTSAKLTALEELLYGKTGQSATQATLPTPAQVNAALT